jgi:hypothetical protein
MAGIYSRCPLAINVFIFYNRIKGDVIPCDCQHKDERTMTGGMEQGINSYAVYDDSQAEAIPQLYPHATNALKLYVGGLDE